MKDPAHNLFYVPPDLIHGHSLVITGGELHHLRNVLRKKDGDLLVLTDGLGNRIEARISRFGQKELAAEIIKKEEMTVNSPPVLDLAIAPLKGTRTDLIIEKSVELGVRRFIFFKSQNSVVKTMSKAKIERFQKIARSAMLQSRQYFLPVFDFQPDLADLTRIFSSYDLVLVADPSGGSNIPPDQKMILYIVGPEGGFENPELASFIKAGARSVSLGRVRLRSETAALAGIVKILSNYRVI